MMKTYKFGIIGAGFIANRFTTVLKENERANIVAVVDKDTEKARKFAEKHGVPRVLSFDELWNEELDAVYVGLPNNAHVPVTVEALNHGLNVICEKPMAMTVALMDQLLEAQKAAGRILMEGMWSRCLPVFDKINEWIQTGRIGEVRMIDSSFSENPPFVPEHRLYNPELGGGSMFDVGIYNIAYAIGLLGTPSKVDGMAVIGKTGVDEQAVITMEFENGAIAYSSCGFQTKTIADARIYGTKGYIWSPDFYKADLCVLYDDAGNEIERFTDSFTDGFVYEIEHFISLLDKGVTESDRLTLTDSMLYAKIYDELRGKWGIANY